SPVLIVELGRTSEPDSISPYGRSNWASALPEVLRFGRRLGLACSRRYRARQVRRIPDLVIRRDLIKHMINRRFAKNALVGIAASGAAIALAATAFAAAPTYKITAGTKTSGTIGYTGKATGTAAKPAIHFNDKTHGAQTTCVSATA